MSALVTILRGQWFLLLLLIVLVTGMACHRTLDPLTDRFPRGWLVAGVMYLSSLPIRLADFGVAWRRWPLFALALGLSAIVAPGVAWGLGWLLPRPLDSGLLVAGSVPCTLASAVVWTRRGNGNDALTLCVTVLTNVACFAVIPITLTLLSGRDVALPFTPRELAAELAVQVLLPIIVAQISRVWLTTWLQSQTVRAVVSVVAQLGVLAMILLGAVAAGRAWSESAAAPVGVTGLGAVVLCVLVMHLALFAVGWWGSLALGGTRGDSLAVALSGSQKTLMIGIDVALAFGGLAIVPMIAYHVGQLVVDTLLVDRIRRAG